MTATLQEFLITRYEDDIDDHYADLMAKSHLDLSPDTLDRLKRQLARSVALRRMVQLHSPGVWSGECAYCGSEGQELDCTYPCDHLRIFGEEFTGHPDYSDAWLPTYPCPDKCNPDVDGWMHWWGFHQPNLLATLGLTKGKP